jgi:hypothetical protein
MHLATARSRLKWWQIYLRSYRKQAPRNLDGYNAGEREMLAGYDRERLQHIHAEFYKALDNVWMWQLLIAVEAHGDWNG